MKNFEVKGTFRERNADKKFSKTVQTINENTAKEKILTLIGSKHKVKRIHIKIESVKESKD